ESALGFGEKSSRFVATLSHSFASGGGDFLVVIFGHDSEYCALICNHGSKSASESGLMAIDRTFRLAHPAIDAFVGVDHQHVFAFVEAIDRTHFHAVRVLAFDTAFRDDVSHVLVTRLNALATA